MKSTITSLAIILAATCVQSVNACYYGGDPDITQFVNGDAISARKAFDRLVQRGKNALNPVRTYRARAITQQQSYERYLALMIARDPQYKLTEDQFQKQIEQIQTWLQWNKKRLQKVDGLIYILSGKDLVGESWAFHWRTVG